jgi:hypothetical protein
LRVLVAIPRVSVVSRCRAVVGSVMGRPEEGEFTAFMREVEPRLHRALVAFCGWEGAQDATAEALAYAWEHWPRIRGLHNPVGYLFRVGQSRSRVRKAPPVFVRPETSDHWIEPALPRRLAELPERQRVAVVVLRPGHVHWDRIECASTRGVDDRVEQSTTPCSNAPCFRAPA